MWNTELLENYTLDEIQCFSLSQAKSMVKDLQHKHKTHANGLQPGFGQALTNHWSFQVYGGHWAATTLIYWTLSHTQ